MIRKKGIVAAVLVLFASALVSAGGMAPGAASGALEIGGYADVLYTNYDEGESTFALGHFCLDMAAELSDDVVVMAEVEWARALPNVLSAAEVDAEIVAACIDCKIVDPITLRAGKFLVPFNVYNTTLAPADVAKLATAPMMNQNVIPSKWAETGLQIYGAIDTGTEVGLDYAVYMVNGLDGTALDAIPAMKNNDVDVNDGDKAIGGRLGLTTPGGIVLGISGYSGAYTADGAQDITMLGLDVCYAYEAFQLIAEYVDADQDGGVVESTDGFYMQGAYKFLEDYEVVVRYEEVDLTGDSIDKITIGGNYMITDDLTFRVAYEWSDAYEGDGVVGQLAVRF